MLRRSVLEKLIQNKAERACSSDAFTANRAFQAQCREASTAALRASVEKMVEWADGGRGDTSGLIELPLPSFRTYEQATYGSVCDELTASAESTQAWTEGNLWVQGEREREAFIATLAAVDTVALALERPWVSE